MRTVFALNFLLAFAAAIGTTTTTACGQDTRPATVMVAAIQCSSELGAVAANRGKLLKLVSQAASNGAKIVVLPEAAITGYLSQDLKTNWHLENRPLDHAYHGINPLPFAQTIPGESTDQFAKMAANLGIYITVPLIEIDRRDNQVRLFNTVCLVAPNGKVVAHYRKLAPWPVPEKSWATPGDLGVQVYDTEYGRVGLAICFDIHTILPKYQPFHIWALLYSSAWVDENHPAEWFWHTLPDGVKPFHHYVIGANWSVDEKQTWFGYGFSEVIGLDGTILSAAKSLHGSEIVYATIPTQWAK
jgi:predicted amidohydrolase